uniref:hypothetical protein n=1 Tax=Flavobacterium sp. TaxID=239 RepID=UPI0040473397
MAINTGVGTPDQLFLGAAVVHGKGIEINRGVVTGQSAKVNGLAVDAATQQQFVHLRGKVKPGRSVGIQTLTQGGARRNAAQPKSADEEGVRAKVLDRVKVVLSQTQLGQIALEALAVGDARANREGSIDQWIKIDAFEIFANECQTGVRAEVVGQLFDDKVGHIGLTCRVS